MLTLSQTQHDFIKQTLCQHHGMLPVNIVQNMLSECDCTIDQFLQLLLPIATEFAVMPISQYRAGAVALGETGNVYLGANQEFSELELNQAVHAEQAVVAVAHQHGETNIEKLATSANPCGHCRQFLFELEDGGDLQILVNGHDAVTLHRLLPHAFGPKDLNIVGGLLTRNEHALALEDAQDNLFTLGLHAAQHSYAPYTNAYCGVVLRLQNGETCGGSYLENVAYNPSLPAMQAALANLIMSGHSYADVTEAVMVQVKNKSQVVNHDHSSQSVLAAVCPNLVLRTAYLSDKSL